VDSDEDYVFLNYSPPSLGNRLLPPDCTIFHSFLCGGSTHGDPERVGHYEGGRVAGTSSSSRQRRIQEHDPYRRPSQRASTSPAPHSDQIGIVARTQV
jgi:hypothetical protein